LLVPASDGAWTPISEDQYWADKGRWSPDGETIYFVSNSIRGFLNVWGIRFDLDHGKSLGEPFQVTDFQSPSRMVSPVVTTLEISLTKTRLVLPILEVSGSVWTLDNVDR
jgi:WD40 repeat protein